MLQKPLRASDRIKAKIRLAENNAHHDHALTVEISSTEAKRLWERARYAAGKFGFAEHSEDFAQDVLLKFSEGRGRHQTIDQAVIDAIRTRFGRPGLPGHAQRHALESAVPIDFEDGEPTIRAAVRGPQGDGIDFERLLRGLDARTREIFELRFGEGWTQLEIGQRLGITESRVNQILASELHAMRRRMNAEEGRVTEIEMETRQCACGCGLPFRCLSSSTQKYASQNCQASVTPGGYAEVMKLSKKRVRMKDLPPNASGVVSSNELAKMLGVSYQSIYLWTKSGRIVPIDDRGRNKKYDLADVRRRLTTGKPQETIIESRKEAVASHEAVPSQEEKAPERSRMDQSVAISAEDAQLTRQKVAACFTQFVVDSETPPSATTDTPGRKAFRAYRSALKRELTAARSDGDDRTELALLRRLVGLNFVKFERALDGISA